MPQPQLTLPQQYGRFLVTGAFVFVLVFWGLSQFLISSHDAHLNFAAIRLTAKASVDQPFPVWLQNFETAYLPFFLRQRSLLACYMIASAFAWLAGFFHDTKILRKENTL
jgi:hypothetical protein